MHVTCLIRLVTCIDLGTFYVQVSFLYLHACSMHVSCKMHGFGTFSMCAACMLHACNMHATIQYQTLLSQSAQALNYMYTYVRGEVNVICDVERVKTNTYVTFSIHSFSNMHQASHVSYMQPACYMPAISLLLLLHALHMLHLL